MPLFCLLAFSLGIIPSANAYTLGADSSNSLSVEIKNSSDSIVPLDGVSVNVTMPSFINSVSISPQGPVSIQPGNSQTFNVTFSTKEHALKGSKGNIQIVVDPTTPNALPDVWETSVPIDIETVVPRISITRLREDDDPSGTYIIGRLFRVDVSDPLLNNGSYSGLDYVQLNNVKHQCGGSRTWSGQIYVETPAWIRVEAKDMAE